MWEMHFTTLPQRVQLSIRQCAFAAAIVAQSCLSFAALGGDVHSVLADQAHFQGSLKTAQLSAYAVHEIHTQTGTVIREYLSPAGTVFAVTWQGGWTPDMRQLLGPYFQRYVAAVQQHADARFGRRPVRIADPDFVVEMSGHSRSFAGRAYLPAMMPNGVRAEAIQ